MKKLSLAKFAVISLILGGFFGALFAIGESKGLWAQAQTARYGALLFIAGMIFTVPYSIVWWKRIDEAVREAHKWAWFWGASAGMTLTSCLVAADYAFGLNLQSLVARLYGADTPIFVLGFAFAIIPMIIGYGIAWGMWWLRHR